MHSFHLQIMYTGADVNDGSGLLNNSMYILIR